MVMLNNGTVVAFGVLHSATPGNDYCNGEIAVMHQAEMACMCDCLHIDDVAELLAEKGLDKRPEGKPSMKRDNALLCYHFGSKKPDPLAKPLYSKMEPSLLEELEARGYDITTLRFNDAALQHHEEAG